MGHYFDWNVERKAAGLDEFVKRAPQTDDIDHKAICTCRLSRIRSEMKTHGIDAMFLRDGFNIRYATGTRNMQIWTSRNAPARYLLLTQQRSILFKFAGCAHLALGFEDTVDEVHKAKGVQFNLERKIEKKELEWSREMGDLVKELVRREGALTVGFGRMNAGVDTAIAELSFRIVDAQSIVELAKTIKCPGEILSIKDSLRATERGVHIL